MNIDNYPGAKSNSGIREWMINNIPVHNAYHELCAGSAKLYYAKRPAKWNFLNDANPMVAAYLQANPLPGIFTRVTNQNLLLPGDANPLRRAVAGDFVYLDPPYPTGARRSNRRLYQVEMLSDDDHVQLLSSIRSSKANIMISTRQNDLYEQLLGDWRKAEFATVDRGGATVEVIYMNYPEPAILHQYDYVGLGFSDRQRVKRKVQRFTDKIEDLPRYEKHMFIQQMILNDRTAVQHFLTMAAATK